MAVLGVVAVLAAACGGSGDSDQPGTAAGSEQLQEGGTLRIGTASPLSSLNKFAGPAGIYPAFTVIYPALVQLDPKTLDFRPDFATSWETSSDGLTWTFKTRPGAAWSDGRPLTAEDAAFTLTMVVTHKRGPTANYANAVVNLVSATAPDPNTVVLTYETPVSNVLTQVQSVGILPKHVWEPVAAGDGSGIRGFANAPAGGQPLVGGGPFVVTEFKKDDILLFAKNPSYYGTKPLVDGVGVKVYANQDAMVTALKNGEIDAISGVAPTAVESLRSAGFVVSAIPGLFRNDLVINASSNKSKNRELLDPKVRQALEHAVDREGVARVVSLGFAQPGGPVVPPAAGKWHNGGIRPLAFDVARANQLLDEAGHRRGADGTRVADGHPMSYEVILDPSLDRAFEIVRSGFERVGVKLAARPLDRAAALAAVKGSDNRYADFDMAISLAGGTPQIDPDFTLSGTICATLGIYNTTGYCDPEYDRLYRQQSVTPDPQRVDVVHRMQAMLYESRAAIVLTYPNAIDAWSPKWTGLVPSGRGLFGQIWVDTFLRAHGTG